jgi:hypothetical protein
MYLSDHPFGIIGVFQHFCGDYGIETIRFAFDLVQVAADIRLTILVDIQPNILGMGDVLFKGRVI